MGARTKDRIANPDIGMVIVENDPRGALPKQIIGIDSTFVYTRSGRKGRGRLSRIRRRRLAEGRYHLES